MPSKLTLHLQYIPPWLTAFYDACDGKLCYIKGVDVYPNLPGVRCIGRPYVDDRQSNAWVREGANGAVAYVQHISPTLRANPHVWAWQLANEFLLDSKQAVDAFNDFWLKALALMSAMGFRCMAGNINTGWPRLRKYNDPPPWPRAIRPMLDELVRQDGIISFHEYAWPDICNAPGNILRWLDTRDESDVRPFPQVFIGELGLDSVVAGRFPHEGWQAVPLNADAYLAQLAWYDAQVSQEVHLLGAAVFTVCSWDWHSFNVTEELAMKLARYIATH